MTNDFIKKFTNQDIAHLYFLVGKAICMIQNLEDAISHSITLKKEVKYPNRISKEEADNFLEKYRSYTLGGAIKEIKESNLYSDSLYIELKNILDERNWLVHKLLKYNLYDFNIDLTRNKLFHKIESISNKANELQRIIEIDLIEISESLGRDMTKIRAAFFS